MAIETTDPKTSCCFSGHRRIPLEIQATLSQRLKDGIVYLYSNMKISTFYVGGALGFDYEKRKVMRSEILCALYENENQKNHFA